jgi:glycosyltransferase involved in cell wall biosynthesis
MQEGPMSSKPKVSVIIPMYNASSTIVETLRGLEKQSFKDFEVIVVDDGSTDDSLSIVEESKTKCQLDITIMTQQNAGPAKARNSGAFRARGDILVFTDADCIHPENWVDEMIRPIGNDIVGTHCGYEVINKDSIVARYVNYEIKKRHSKLHGKIVDSVGTYSFSILKEVFGKMGGYDTSYHTASAEDFDFSYRLSEKRYKIYFTERTSVFHHHPESVLGYIKQQFYRGYWRVPLYLQNKSKITSRDSYSGFEVQIQFLIVGLLLLSFIGMYYVFYLPILFLGLLCASNIGYGVFSFRYERRMLFIAPVLASFRSLSGFFGAVLGLVSYRRK